MYICLCKSLTDRDIHHGVLRGEVACMQSLRERLGASTGCGSCAAAARQCLDEALAYKRCLGGDRAGSGNREVTAADLHMPGLGDASPA
ncbi:MAG: (2Fe-2S)-binding protein [Gammaproteobacteria bacterium]|nr:(2Fe-2S)-binding protein [Gammaproteobacteria bacterium]